MKAWHQIGIVVSLVGLHAVMPAAMAQDPSLPLVWQEQTGLASVPQTSWTRMTYDSVRRVCLVLEGSAAFQGLWAWNGATWSQLLGANAGPEAVDNIVFDSRRGVAVIYTAPAAQEPGHTWEWNGTTLTPVMAYDAERRVIVMFGGLAGITQGSASFRETWTWDGTTWTLVSTTGPGGREAHQMVYDSARQKVLLFGGTDGSETGGNLGLNDLWEWDGSQWTQLSPPGRPPPRYDPGFAYDSSRRQAVLFGGLRRISGGLIDLNDTWLLDPQSVWVHFAYTGVENGTFSMPFNTVVEGVSAAPTGGVVRIKPSSAAQTPTIAKRVTLDAPIGPATIGRP